MNITRFYTPKEFTAWVLAWFLALMVCIDRGGAELSETRTPDQNTSEFCRAYVMGELR